MIHLRLVKYCYYISLGSFVDVRVVGKGRSRKEATKEIDSRKIRCRVCMWDGVRNISNREWPGAKNI